MGAAVICRIVGGVLVVLVGAAIGAGGVQLWQGGPATWPDVVGNETTVRRTSGGMILFAALLVTAGVAAASNLPWGVPLAASATIAVVLAAFWANYALFGNIRPVHTVTNVIVAAIIVALLWVGHSAHAR